MYSVLSFFSLFHVLEIKNIGHEGVRVDIVLDEGGGVRKGSKTHVLL